MNKEYSDKVYSETKTERQGKSCPSPIICCYHTEPFTFQRATCQSGNNT